MTTVTADGQISAPTFAPATPFLTLRAASSNTNALVTWVTSSGEVQASLFANGALQGSALSITPSSDGFPPTVDEMCEAPELASNGAQQLLLTCFRFSDNFRVSRITTRLIDTSADAPPTAVESGD